MADRNKKTEIKSINIELTKFSIYTVTSLADNIYKIYCKWVINDFTKYNNNDLFTSFIINIGAKFATHIKKSFTICHCQIDKFDCPDIGNINYVKKDIILL